MPEPLLAQRLRRLPIATVLGREVRVAGRPRARLLGLAHLDREKVGAGLLIPRCSSVHTFGMRFPLDLIFLDRRGSILAIRREIGPGRVVWRRHAIAVLEVPSRGQRAPPGPRVGDVTVRRRVYVANVVEKIDRTDPLEYPRSILAVLLGVPAAIGALGVAIGSSAIWVACLGLEALMTLALALLKLLQVIAERRGVASAVLKHSPRAIADLTPYTLGADQESPQALKAIGQIGNASYVQRDSDRQLRERIDAAASGEGTPFVVLYGPSKAGKSRSLYEVARQSLPSAIVLAPRDSASIEILRDDRLWSKLDSDPIVWWLDDLEDYVEVGSGMSPRVLDSLATRKGRTVILATAGGRGARRRSQGAGEQVAEPMAELLRHAEVVELGSDLSCAEKDRIGEFSAQVTTTMGRDGIGEFMITAPELVHKLRDGRYGNGPKSPEGQAVAWAAIDWRRAGIVDPVPRELLSELYAHFLPEYVDPSPEGFDRGLAWAREPLYETIALLRGGPDRFRAYDFIVEAGARSSEIGEDVWTAILDRATAEQAFAMGLAAYEKRDG